MCELFFYFSLHSIEVDFTMKVLCMCDIVDVSPSSECDYNARESKELTF